MNNPRLAKRRWPRRLVTQRVAGKGLTGRPLILAAMRNFTSLSALLFCGAASVLCAQTVTVSFPASQSARPLDGRVLFLVSNNPAVEPRMEIDDTPRTQMVFGKTVDGWKPGDAVTIDAQAAGYPVRSIADVPPGDYTVQAVLNVYETFHRGDGKTVKLAPDRGEGQHWNLARGICIALRRRCTLALAHLRFL